jgi:hypothetical protein
MSIQQANGSVNLQAALNRLVKAGTVDPNILLKYSQNPPPDLGDKGALLVSLASSIVARNKDGMNASMPAPSETVTEQVQNKLAQSDQPQGIASLNPSSMMPATDMANPAPAQQNMDAGVSSLPINENMFNENNYANGGIVAFAAGDLVKDPYAAFRMPIPKIPTADDLVMETQELKSGFVDPDFYKKRKQDLEAQTLEDIKESREADKANVLFKLAEGFGTTPGGFVRGAVAAGVKAGPAIAEMNKNIIAAKRLNRAALNELEQAKYAESIGDFKTAAALKESARTKEFEAQKVNATTGATIEAAQIKSAAARAMDPANTRTKALNATIQQFEKIYGQGSYLTSFKQKKTNLMNEFNQMLKNNLNFIREEELPEASLETTPKADSSKTTKKEIKTPVKETQAQYQNRIKEEKARQKYPQLFKNYDQTTSDVGGTLIDVTNAEEMERLEREGRFVNTD